MGTICTSSKKITIKQLQKLTQDHVGDNDSIGREQFLSGNSEFSRLLEGNNIMPTVISYKRYSLEAMRRAIKWIIIPDNVMTL